MATPAIKLDGDWWDYEALTRIAASLEKTEENIVFKPPVGLAQRGVVTGVMLAMLNGGMVHASELGGLLYYVADILENSDNRIPNG